MWAVIENFPSSHEAISGKTSDSVMKPLSFSNNVKCRPPTGLRSNCLSVCAYLCVTQIGRNHNPTRDFLLLFALVTNPPIQIITTVSQHRRSDLTEKLSPLLFSDSLFRKPPHSPWWWASGGMERSASQQTRPGSSGSREARGSAGPASLLRTGTAGPGWSCCSLGSGRSLRPRLPEELSWRLRLGQVQKEVQDGDGRRWQSLEIPHYLCSRCCCC